MQDLHGIQMVNLEWLCFKKAGQYNTLKTQASNLIKIFNKTFMFNLNILLQTPYENFILIDLEKNIFFLRNFITKND